MARERASPRDGRADATKISHGDRREPQRRCRGEGLSCLARGRVEEILHDRSSQKKRRRRSRHQGFSPARLSHTAWDLALANQSLAYIESDLGFALSDLYNTQEQLTTMTMGLSQAMSINPPGENLTRFFDSVAVSYGDATLIEPQLLKAFEAILPRIDNALGDAAAK